MFVKKIFFTCKHIHNSMIHIHVYLQWFGINLKKICTDKKYVVCNVANIIELE